MFNIIRQWIIDTLGFSKTEANGTLILIFVILIFAIFPRLYLRHRVSSDSHSHEQAHLQEWKSQLEASLRLKKENVPENKKVPPVLFPFNPNTASYSQLLDLGLGERTAKNLINYRDHGGSFSKKDDLKKIYGLNDQTFESLKPYISLPENILENKTNEEITLKTPAKLEARTPDKLDLNSVSAEQLQTIKGIGPGYSSRIVKYRDLLGGFIDINQLGEVYNLPDDIEMKLKEAFFVEGKSVRRIHINSDSIKHMAAHPYLNYNVSRAIFNYRQQRGKIDSLPQLREIKIISDSLYQRIYPYLSI